MAQSRSKREITQGGQQIGPPVGAPAGPQISPQESPLLQPSAAAVAGTAMAQATAQGASGVSTGPQAEGGFKDILKRQFGHPVGGSGKGTPSKAPKSTGGSP